MVATTHVGTMTHDLMAQVPFEFEEAWEFESVAQEITLSAADWVVAAIKPSLPQLFTASEAAGGLFGETCSISQPTSRGADQRLVLYLASHQGAFGIEYAIDHRGAAYLTISPLVLMDHDKETGAKAGAPSGFDLQHHITPDAYLSDWTVSADEHVLITAGNIDCEIDGAKFMRGGSIAGGNFEWALIGLSGLLKEYGFGPAINLHSEALTNETWLCPADFTEHSAVTLMEFAYSAVNQSGGLFTLETCKELHHFLMAQAERVLAQDAEVLVGLISELGGQGAANPSEAIEFYTAESDEKLLAWLDRDGCKVYIKDGRETLMAKFEMQHGELQALQLTIIDGPMSFARHIGDLRRVNGNFELNREQGRLLPLGHCAVELARSAQKLSGCAEHFDLRPDARNSATDIDLAT